MAIPQNKCRHWQLVRAVNSCSGVTFLSTVWDSHLLCKHTTPLVCHVHISPHPLVRLCVTFTPRQTPFLTLLNHFSTLFCQLELINVWEMSFQAEHIKHWDVPVWSSLAQQSSLELQHTTASYEFITSVPNLKLTLFQSFEFDINLWFNVLNLSSSKWWNLHKFRDGWLNLTVEPASTW